LPSAAALADATSNPTVPGVGAFAMGFNGTTWDRIRTANTGRLQVDVITGGGGTNYTEDAALGAVGSAQGLLNIARAGATAPTAVSADNDAVALWAARFGALNVILRDTSGAYVGAGGGSQYVEDVASAGGETMTLAGAIRQDTIASSTSTDGDYANLKVDSVGRLYTGTDIKTVAGTAITLGQKAMAASLPVVIASDQGAVPVSGTFWQSTQPVSIAATVTVDSELPTAASLADATANPTVPGVGGFLMGFNGTTWDRIRTANTGRLQVDVVSGASAASPSELPSGYNMIDVYGSTSATAAGGNADVASNTPANTKAVYIRQISASASGATKVQLLFGATVKWVGFLTASEPTGIWRFDPPIPVTGDGATALKVNVTNREASAMDLYARINAIVQA
jgi:hypothetical protein